MRIRCPHCGERSNAEFAYLGDADPIRPQQYEPQAGEALDSPAWKAWHDYVYLRTNPPGSHRELWQHHAGCRAWLIVTRNVTTHEIAEVALASAMRLDLARPGAAG